MIKIFKLFFIVIFGFICGVSMVVSYNALASKTEIVLKPPRITDPLWIKIPSIDVLAPVKAIGIDKSGRIGVTVDGAHVGWYKFGPRPGMNGVAIMDGHVSTKEMAHAVFYRLDELKIGDEIKVNTENGDTITFRVTDMKKYAYNVSAENLFIPKSNKPELVLITCTGDWMPDKKIFSERLEVFAEKI